MTTKRLLFSNNYLKSREADDCLRKFVLLVRNALQVSVGVASR